MRPRHRSRPWLALGLASAVVLSLRAGAEPPDPIPGYDLGTRTVKLLDARDAGEVAVTARGKGEDRVGLTIRNQSDRRLNVVMPPGLVAASATGQFQSMGLGDAENGRGAFGSFDPGDHPFSEGNRPDPAAERPRGRGVIVPVGQAIDLVVPGVCLNYGLPTPTPHDLFRLVDVDDYTQDPVARKALRALATIGTSHGVAQAVAWRAFSSVPFDELARQTLMAFNAQELAIATDLHSRVAFNPSIGVDPDSLIRDRLTIQVRGEGPLAEVARRLESDLDNHRILGLIARASAPPEPPGVPALHLSIALKPGKGDEPARARLSVRQSTRSGDWILLGQAQLPDERYGRILDGSGMIEAVERAIAETFVSARPVRHAVGSTTLRIDNRLPWTLAHVVVRAGDASIPLTGLGVGAGRHGRATIQAASGTIERVEFNGL